MLSPLVLALSLSCPGKIRILSLRANIRTAHGQHMDSTWTMARLLASRLRPKMYFEFFSITKPDIVISIVVRYIPD